MWLKKHIVLILFLLFTQYYVSGQSFERADTINAELLSSFTAESNIPGIAVAVYIKGNLIWSWEYGFSNLEYHVPVSDFSKFRMASISKLFTGTAILKLPTAGRLHLDDRILIYLDSLPSAWNDITIRPIAQHTSGISHYTDEQNALDVQSLLILP